MRVHVQIEYTDAQGNSIETLTSVDLAKPSGDPIMMDLYKEWVHAVVSDPKARLVFGGRCECSTPERR